MALVMENKGIKILSAIEFFVLVAHFCMPGLMKTRVGLIINIIGVINGILLIVFGIRELIKRHNRG
ncbi:MAG: hypothetical protein IKE95_06390 [Methanobrevibacter sp.]|nr:hypothetical protein [Methanobrevibacter sp.]